MLIAGAQSDSAAHPIKELAPQIDHSVCHEPPPPQLPPEIALASSSWRNHSSDRAETPHVEGHHQIDEVAAKAERDNQADIMQLEKTRGAMVPTHAEPHCINTSTSTPVATAVQSTSRGACPQGSTAQAAKRRRVTKPHEHQQAFSPLPRGEIEPP